MEKRVLLFSHPDQAGIIARIASVIAEHGGNIERSEQYTSSDGSFFLRFLYEGDDLSDAIRNLFPEGKLRSHEVRRKKVVVFVSHEDHCLLDLLWRQDELSIEILSVISNHEDSRQLTESLGIPFHYVKQGKDRAAGEREILEKLSPDADFAILARYMRILSGDFLRKAKIPFINVHHSFLPAFPGAKPYEQAYQRGVKIIGATAHYVIEELDAGPIISQRTTAVSHKDSIRDLVRKGREEERLVLLEAVRAHAEDRIIEDSGKTIIFSH